MRAPAASVDYRETQHLDGVNRAMVLGLGVVIFALALVPIASGLYQQLVLGRPWGDKPAPDAALVGVGVVTLLLTLLPVALLSLTLTVDVGAQGLVVRLDVRAPISLILMRPRRIPREEIVEATLASRSALGAGASRVWRRESYKVSGRDGVELTLRSGKTVFVGSQQPRALLAAIEALRAS
jgi:hypothetical protein